MSDRPLTRLAREIWSENTRDPLTIVATPDSERRVMNQRIHETANLSKFACPIRP